MDTYLQRLVLDITWTLLATITAMSLILSYMPPLVLRTPMAEGLTLGAAQRYEWQMHRWAHGEQALNASSADTFEARHSSWSFHRLESGFYLENALQPYQRVTFNAHQRTPASPIIWQTTTTAAKTAPRYSVVP